MKHPFEYKSMKLRLIGVEHSRWVDVHSDARYGDFVREPVYPKLAVPLDLTELPDFAEIHYNEFRVTCLNFSKDDRTLFLVPRDMTDKEAILYQFNKK